MSCLLHREVHRTVHKSSAMHTMDFVLIYNLPLSQSTLLTCCRCGACCTDITCVQWPLRPLQAVVALSVPVPLPSSTARQSKMPKAWKYLCYKDSWAECAWCMSLCFLHTVQQQQALNFRSVNAERNLVLHTGRLQTSW